MAPIESHNLILAADVGGTNLNLALLAQRQGRYEICRKWRGLTHGEPSLLEPILRFLAQCRAEGFTRKPALASIAAAGPVQGRHILLSNAPWDVDGAALEAALDMPVHLMNDFTAIAYGVALLDPADEAQVIPLPHGDGSLPAPDPGGTSLVVGAGTGLGVGYVTRSGGRPWALPSEGGHIGLPVMDDLTLELWQHLGLGLPGPPDAETAVSGPGITAIFSFLLETARAPRSPLAQTLLSLPSKARPSAISAHAGTDEACARTLELFVDLYARVCAELCTVILPTGGLYLAGGIAAKNASHFLDNNRFMRAFERNARVHINTLIHATPVYIVRDYDISLYGAALGGGLYVIE